MGGEERLAELPLQAEEADELLGEDVGVVDVEPGLVGDLLVVVARWGQLAEAAIGDRQSSS